MPVPRSPSIVWGADPRPSPVAAPRAALGPQGRLGALVARFSASLPNLLLAPAHPVGPPSPPAPLRGILLPPSSPSASAPMASPSLRALGPSAPSSPRCPSTQATLPSLTATPTTATDASLPSVPQDGWEEDEGVAIVEAADGDTWRAWLEEAAGAAEDQAMGDGPVGPDARLRPPLPARPDSWTLPWAPPPCRLGPSPMKPTPSARGALSLCEFLAEPVRPPHVPPRSSSLRPGPEAILPRRASAQRPRAVRPQRPAPTRLRPLARGSLDDTQEATHALAGLIARPAPLLGDAADAH